MLSPRPRPIFCHGRARDHVLPALQSRSERPWLAMVVVPLATVAVMLVGVYPLLVPLAYLGWWWGARDASFLAAIAAMQLGLFGTVWALFGIYAIAAHHADPLGVGVVWAAAAAVIAAAAAALSRRYGRGYRGPQEELP